MARGDASISLTASVAADAITTIQPGSGVEILLQRAGSDREVGAAPNGVPDVALLWDNGTVQSYFTGYGAPEVGAHLVANPFHFHLTNSIYAGVQNRGGTSHITINGTVTK